MRPLRKDEIERLRKQPGGTALLYITDRCPVGCLHCSVNATPDGNRVTDWPRFESVVQGLALSSVRVVAISGGEPFVERRALSHSVSVLKQAGKQIVVFTSGSWARSASTPRWISDVLSQVSTAYLSTDVFHSLFVDQHSFDLALATLIEHDCHVVVQVLRLTGREIIDVRQRISSVCGGDPADRVEVSEIHPLPQGRGSVIFEWGKERELSALGRCTLSGSPTIRYDGRAAPCCNEGVITGQAPTGLLIDTVDRYEVANIAEGRFPNGVVEILTKEGAAGLAQRDAYAPLADSCFSGICDVCWKAVALTESVSEVGGVPQWF